MKPATLAKLSAASASHLKDAERFSSQLPLSNYCWTPPISFLALTMEGISCYWQAQAKLEEAKKAGSGFGIAVGYGEKSVAVLERALSLSDNSKNRNLIPISMVDPVRGVLEKAREQRDEFENDNRVIYLEVPPTEMDEVPAVSLVKVSPLLPAFYNSDPDLFPTLIPPQILSLSSSIKGKATDIKRNVVNHARTRTDEARAQLASVNLPGALDSFRCGGGLPEDLWNRMVRVNAMGGEDCLFSRMRDLEGARRQADGSLRQIDQSLHEEERVDETFRSRHSGFSSKRSNELNEDVREDLSRYLRMFDEACSSDGVIFDQMGDEHFLQDLRLTSRPREEVESRLPDPSSHNITRPLSVDESVVDTSCLEGELGKLATIISTREELINKVEEVGKDEEIMKRIMVVWSDLEDGSKKEEEDDEDEKKKMVSSVVNENEVEREVLVEINDIKSQIEEGDEQQDSLLESILIENEKFLNAKSSDPATLEKDRIVNGIEVAVDSFHTLHARMGEGVTFYSTLQSKLTDLLQRSQDLAYTQHLQRTDFEMNLQRQEEEKRKREETNPFNPSPMPPLPNPPHSGYQDQPPVSSYPTLDTNPFSPNNHQQLNHNPPPTSTAPPSMNHFSLTSMSSQTPPPQTPPGTLDGKIGRLVEMGFERSKVLQALVSNNEDENLALNSLLQDS